MTNSRSMTRRQFVSTASGIAAGALVFAPFSGAVQAAAPGRKKRLAMVGTGSRGSGMWGKNLLVRHGGDVEFIGLCDINPGRVKTAREYIGVHVPVFTDFDAMLKETKPDAVIVTTVDATHNYFIVKALEAGCGVIVEKPLTTDEEKLREILTAQRQTGGTVVVTFNYRYSPHRAKIKELLMQGRIGKITSVDFHWYLDTIHGADYFRRWHRLRKHSGTLLLHKASHHFDLLNWWIDSDPEVVYGFGALEYYGKNGPFRHTHCRACPHKAACPFFFDMTKDKFLMDFYAANEQYDGYLRDGCVFREDIDIFDKMAVQVRYANSVQVSYSLTTYSPYEGYRIAFNGTKGRLETWIHERQPWPMEDFDEIRVTDMFGSTELLRVPILSGGHGGGDDRLQDRIFGDPEAPDSLMQGAGTRDGAFAIMLGIAARKSIDSGAPVRIADLSDLTPQKQRAENKG